MAAEKQNAAIYSGDTANLTFTIKDEAGALLGLNGYSAIWLMALEAGEAPIVTKSISVGGIVVDDPATGVLRVNLSANDTSYVGKLWHQLVLTSPANVVTTVATGILTIKVRT